MRAGLTLVHLLPELMNLYGDGGNVLALRRHCEWRGIPLEVVRVGLREQVDLRRCDLLFMGGGQDRDQARVAEELMRHAEGIREYVADGGVSLTICGGFQLFGRHYVTADGTEIGGIGVFDAVTHAGTERLVGDLVVDTRVPSSEPAVWLHTEGTPLVGFENHAGLTELGPGARPLGRVLAGRGNTGDGGWEGAVVRRAVGTYLHGALLPRNPWLTDRLIAEALRRRYGGPVSLTPLDDGLERGAQAATIRRCVGT